jgi:DNA/RNA endonuclease YhcR with UshA esterase domain
MKSIRSLMVAAAFVGAAGVGFAETNTSAAAAAAVITPEEASNYVGKVVTVQGQVVDAKYLEQTASKPTLLNFGAAHPKEIFTAVIPATARGKFSDLPEAVYFRKHIAVTGKVSLYHDKPQIEVTDPAQIKLLPTPPAAEKPAAEKKTEKPADKGSP